MKLITNTLFLSLLLSQSLYLRPVEARTKSAEPAAASSELEGQEAVGKKKKKPSRAEKSESAEKEEKKPEKKASKKSEPTAEELEEEKAYKEYQEQLSSQLKQTKTPFSLQEKGEEQKETNGPLTLNLPRRRLSLQDKIMAPRLYLPGRLILGKPAQFTIKGRPGYWAALAMADRDTGAKAILGQNLRLGPDRKVIALGKIPESGVLALKAYCPIAGDLVGANLYFEAAIWPDGDLNRAEIAQTISSESQVATSNGVLVAEEGEKKKGVRIVPDSAMPMYQRATAGATTLDSGKP